jgi:hypothetical protein
MPGGGGGVASRGVPLSRSMPHSRPSPISSVGPRGYADGVMPQIAFSAMLLSASSRSSVAKRVRAVRRLMECGGVGVNEFRVMRGRERGSFATGIGGSNPAATAAHPRIPAALATSFPPRIVSKLRTP